MAKIIAIHSYRGGTGKSNLTANLASSRIAAHAAKAKSDAAATRAVRDLVPIASISPSSNADIAAIRAVSCDGGAWMSLRGPCIASGRTFVTRVSARCANLLM